MTEFDWVEDVKVDSSDGVSEVRKRFPGVTKSGNRWRARVHHPKLKFDVSLGSYATHEEAVVVVKKKRAEFEEMYKGENSMNEETCWDDFEGRKLPAGVSRRGYKRWGAQVWNPKLKRYLRLGSYNSPEKAAFVVRKKRAEFGKMYCMGQKDKPRCKVNDKVSDEIHIMSEISHKPTDNLIVPKGVTKSKSGKWCARIRDPITRARIWLRTFNAAKDAVSSLNQSRAELAAKRKRGEFEKDVKIDTYDDVCEVRKRVPGVTKERNSWRVRVQHPKLKFRVSLGSYPTHEEAVLVLKKKKAEFDEMLKDKNSVNAETCRDGFEGRNLPYGVSKRGYGRWGAQIWHPMLKRHLRLGSYSTLEEASFVMDKTKAEFLERYGWSPKIKPDSKNSGGNDFVSEKPRRDISDELTSDEELPFGVKKLKSGKWGAGIRDPKTRTKIRLGRFDTVKEAIKALKKGKSELAAKRINSEFDGIEFRPKARPFFESNEGSIEIECASDLNDIASHCDIDKPKRDISGKLGDLEVPSDARNLKSWKWGARLKDPKSRARIRLGTSAIDKEADKALDEAQAEFAIERKRVEYDGLKILPKSFEANERPTKIERADNLNTASIPDKLKSRPTSIYAPQNLSWTDVGDTSVNQKENCEHKSGCVDEFEEAMRMRFINEYGQLLGEYSKLDDQMGFSLPEDCDEVVADI